MLCKKMRCCCFALKNGLTFWYQIWNCSRQMGKHLHNDDSLETVARKENGAYRPRLAKTFLNCARTLWFPSIWNLKSENYADFSMTWFFFQQILLSLSVLKRVLDCTCIDRRARRSNIILVCFTAGYSSLSDTSAGVYKTRVRNYCN